MNDLIIACTNNVKANNDQPIEFLVILGHGSPGSQEVGGGRTPDLTGRKTLRYRSMGRPGETLLYGDAEKKLKTLGSLLDAEGKILLGGCAVAEGDYGTSLMKGMSKAIGNYQIEGFEWSVYWWTGLMIGPLKKVKGDSVSSSFGSYLLKPNAQLFKFN